MVIQRLTTKCGNDKCYQVYMNGELKGTFKESESVTAQADANEMVQEFELNVSRAGCMPKVIYK